jgi:hypothetical protein
MEHCALGLGATALPFKAFAQPLTVRPEWQSLQDDILATTPWSRRSS